MVKTKNKNKNKQQKQKQNPPRRRNRGGGGQKSVAISKPGNPSFGAVSTINTAPVAIGNSMTGFKSQVLHSADGCRVIGRDFAYAPTATGSVTSWALVGGMPLTPACMPSTILRNFLHMYNKFRFNFCLFHYITSSATTTTGDVVFYYQKSPDSSMINWTSSSFLPYVLSDSNTVIGPQWTNHTCKVVPNKEWKSCDYGMSTDQREFSHGDIHLFSKTSSEESPGYIVFDYDITFKELSVHPRAGLLPTIKAQWSPASWTLTGAATAGVTLLGANPVAVTNSTNWIGGTTITALNSQEGDIYKIIVDATNSTFTLPTNTALSIVAQYRVAGGVEDTIITDGMTLYVAYWDATTCTIYPTLEQARVGNMAMSAGFTGTYNIILRGHAKLVSWGDSNLQSSY